ncbi:MAG: threonine synthase [Bacteroidetes bacterium GWC2_33_15]|nr:MAG: threonine synthase [Bacteroidetes bacterium GWA2_33_15]OFX48602.1 MAG: threonine synthase [Bacteroidetes bacterium GWC2_33_15]OFX64576.1 MAG: threonine synthase [Bacteroidetes bacterium GWB2_32_14]OFX68006.1 MAG: threonine synthase [Bacteroidetes bacterium GWD2_33_33]HAN18241.1 threonine synthase [Bacteroidales bacterium]
MPVKIHSQKFIYQCIDCGKQYFTNETTYLCPSCSKENNDLSPPKGVLGIVYNFSDILKKNFLFKDFKKEKFLDLLPINKSENLPKLKVGNTPLYKFNKLDNKDLSFMLYLKDDSQNPTFSFKDRASSLVSAFAKENKLGTIVTASTGNAGSSLAGICASQGQKAIVMVPETAPLAKLTQIIMYGATIVPVKGTYDDAFDLSIKATSEFGWYNRNTAFNPLTIEGKKTVSYEIFDQLNESLPDRIFVPVGDGVIISGVYKGFEDLLNLKIIDKIPVIVAVQSEGSNNLIRNLNNTNFEIKPSNTLADSISVDIPRNFYMARYYIQKYKGEVLSISDEKILDASAVLSRNTGLFAEPAAATAFAGFLNYYNQNKLDNNSKNVVLLTGSGLKDLKSVQKLLNIPESIEPAIDNLKKLIS